MNAYAGEQVSSGALREAGAPFDDIEPGATVYLRSSDNILFGVYKVILAKASPFFAGLFRIPRPITQSSGDEMHHGIPMIRMQEDASTLSLTLSLLYPVDTPTFTSFSDIVNVLAAFEKFMIDPFPKIISIALGDHIDTHPILVYAYGCKQNLSRVSNMAAKATLLSQLPESPPAELLEPHYQALLRYREACVDSINSHIRERIKDAPDSGLTLTIVELKDETCGHIRNIPGHTGRLYRAPDWWVAYHGDVLSAACLRPCGSSAVEATLINRYKQFCSQCTHCGPWASSLLVARSKMLEEEIEVMLRGIEGVIPFV
jgi:hypothetical protein